MWSWTSCVACGVDEEGALCRRCRRRLTPADPVPDLPPLATVRALLRYERRGRDVVHALKYDNQRGLVDELGRAMAAMVDTATVDVVAWAPTTEARRRDRGYDQARVLAAAVARYAGRPLVAWVRRVDGGPQTGRSRAQRVTGPTFAADPTRPGARVLLVDDVVTTGATLRSAGHALRRAGAGEIDGLALAHTPLRTLSGVGPR